MHDSGWDPYDFRVRAVVSTADLAVIAQHSGHTDGTGSSLLGSPNRDNDWSESNTEPRIQRYWSEVRQATMTVNKSYEDTGVLHALEDLFDDFLGFLTASVIVGPHLAEAIVIGNELGEITGLRFGSPSILEGVIVTALNNPLVTGGSVFIFGPGIVIPAIAAGLANAPRHRGLSPDEIAFAAKVFGDTLPNDRIVLTDMAGLNGRGFTFPNIDNTILLNIGPAYDDPIHYSSGKAYATQGQLFIHELTHAWQVAHGSFVAGWICSALDAQVIQGQSAYNVGSAGPPYSDFGIEAQAVIVDRWFGQYASGWKTMTDGDPFRDVDNKLKSSSAVADPYFGYIANNIRLGQT
jgi:hypothetical protein